MSQNSNELYELWSEMLFLVFKEKKISLDEVSPKVREKMLEAFDRAGKSIPEEVLPAYFSYIFKMSKDLRIRPTYKLVGSEKTINNFLSSKNMMLIAKRKDMLTKIVSTDTEEKTDEAFAELDRFITEVKTTSSSLKCDIKEAMALVMNKYLWSHRDAISYFVNRVSSNDTNALAMLNK